MPPVNGTAFVNRLYIQFFCPIMSDMCAATYQPSPNVVFTELDDETSGAVLLHLKTRHYFSLNETGAFIWKHLDRDVDAIVQALAHEYDVSHEDARGQVQGFLQTLAEDHLIEKQS